jgi:hypothetical protein
MKKSYLALTTLLLILCSLVLVSTTQLGKAQGGTNVNGIITTDTTWTLANSPYTLTGALAVNQGVTLTIQAGVTVNLKNNYLQVNGTLVARGTGTDKIQMSNGTIKFTSLSTSWNDQTNTGSIIENAIMDSAYVEISASSPKLNNDKILAGGIDAIRVERGAPIISNCTIRTSFSGIELYDSHSLITNNVIYDFPPRENYGIMTFYHDEHSIIKNNLILNTDTAICVDYGSTPQIESNTIVENNRGIRIDSQIEISNNNFENNSLNIYLTTNSNINLINNWWGTTDTQAINETIYDFKNDFNLGNVTFTPFLMSPNALAPKASNPELALSPSPTAPEFSGLVIVPLLVSVFTIALVLRYRKTTILKQ